MEDKKIPAAQIPPAATDGGQPIHSGNVNVTQKHHNCKSNDLQTITLREIFEHPLTARQPVIEGMLGIGAYILAGAPKIGKSFLVWQIAYAVATGNDLWGLPVRQGSVLVLALEDNEERIHTREKRMLGGEGQAINAPDNLHTAFAADGIDGDLNGQIDRFVAEHPDTILIVVDILQRIRRRGEKLSYANDSETMLALKAIADKHQICLLVVHHTRKEKADDIFEMISGSNGLGGSADGALVLTKETRCGTAATLSVIARDFPDQVLHLQRNKDTLGWLLDYVDAEIWEEPQDIILDSVVSLMEETNEWEGSPTELLTQLFLDLQPNKLTYHLNAKAGKLRGKHGIGFTSSRTHDGRRIKLFHVDQMR